MPGVSSCSPEERARAAYFVQSGVTPFMRAWANELAEVLVQITCNRERRSVNGDAHGWPPLVFLLGNSADERNELRAQRQSTQ